MAFNEMVFEVLKKIPRGKVATYRQVAVALGSPNSARAVGNACGKNLHSPIIPCHRVVASNGLLGGYSGGLDKKIKLLESEGVKVKSNKIVDFNSILVESKELK